MKYDKNINCYTIRIVFLTITSNIAKAVSLLSTKLEPATEMTSIVRMVLTY